MREVALLRGGGKKIPMPLEQILKPYKSVICHRAALHPSLDLHMSLWFLLQRTLMSSSPSEVEIQWGKPPWLELLSMAGCADEEHLGGEPQNGCQLLTSTEIANDAALV